MFHRRRLNRLRHRSRMDGESQPACFSWTVRRSRRDMKRLAEMTFDAEPRADDEDVVVVRCDLKSVSAGVDVLVGDVAADGGNWERRTELTRLSRRRIDIEQRRL